MPQFDFYQDTRIRTWERCHFKVEAESYEAAVAIIKNFCDCDVNNHEEEVEFGPLEILFEHSEKIDPGKNEGRATIRIYAEDDTPIIDNAPFGTDTSGAAKETKTIGRQDNRKKLPEEKMGRISLFRGIFSFGRFRPGDRRTMATDMQKRNVRTCGKPYPRRIRPPVE